MKPLHTISLICIQETNVTKLMKVKILLLGCMVILTNVSSMAQDEKREYEQSIKKRDLPDKILESIEPFLEDAARVRYYYETDGDAETYEVKGKFDKRFFSIEYQKDGTLIDIEKLIDFEEIEEEARKHISEYLQENYDKYVFTRVQQQYYPQKIDAEDAVEDFSDRDFENFETRYELEVDTRAGNTLGSFELLFDHNGKFMEKRKILKRGEDNIFY